MRQPIAVSPVTLAAIFSFAALLALNIFAIQLQLEQLAGGAAPTMVALA